jgi:hypothetical protein
MNNLINRDYHECIGFIIPIEMNEDIRLGNALLDKIPFNQVEEVEEVEVEDDYYSQLQFNTPNKDNTNVMEKILIEQKNYWGLYQMYLNTEPFKRLPKLSLYSFVRSLVGKPVMKSEYTKINNDIKSIKKSMKQIKKKSKMKKNTGDYSCNFK